MSFDSIGGNAAAYSSYTGGRALFDVTGALTSGEALAHRNAAEQMTGTALNMGVQQAAAHKMDKSLGKNASGQTSTAPRSYGQMFGLKGDQIKLSEFTPDKFRQTVASNFSDFGKDIKAGNVSAKTFAKETLIQRNTQPLKEVFTNTSGANVGSNIIKTAGVGLMGFDVLKNTRDTYRDAKSQEDGSFGSKLHTAKETTEAFGKYAGRNIVTWEAASIGAQAGKNLLPVALKGVPLGGVLGGAMAVVASQKVMNKLLKTGDKDPVQQRKAIAKAEKQGKVTEAPLQESS